MLGPVVIVPTGGVVLHGGVLEGAELRGVVGACTTGTSGGVAGDLAGALAVAPGVASSGGVTGDFTSGVGGGPFQALMMLPVP